MKFEQKHLIFIALLVIAVLIALVVSHKCDMEHFEQKVQDAKETVRQTINDAMLKYFFGKTIGARQL